METELLGCRLYYHWQRKEDPKAPTVLLLHGWGCDSTIFSFIESGLDTSVLSVDFPGHGKSGEPPVAWGVPEYKEQLVQLLSFLGIDKVMVVAHSFGGRVAILLAAEHPDMVEKLVITGGAGIRKPVSESQQKRQQRYKRYNAMLNSLKNVKPLAAHAEKWQNALRQHFGSSDYNRLNENMRKTFVKVISLDLFPRLKEIKCSTLLIWGSEDTETPVWMGEQMEKEIPDAALIVFDGRTHFAFIEEWQRFLIIIKQFFLGGVAA
ncbi:MAG: alpha/beta hydrolase [Eubacteriales bacterium]|nr:alpha/beta hydrolase [Eubacteriales bacterium]